MNLNDPYGPQFHGHRTKRQPSKSSVASEEFGAKQKSKHQKAESAIGSFS
jgi:hypothetical protein